MITKAELDELANKYETKKFIETDPIQVPHMYNKSEEIELVGFISSLFAYGNRKMFIPKLYELFEIMDNNPIEYIKKGYFKNLNNFNYRFAKEKDVECILKVLSKLYQHSNLNELFEYGYKRTESISGTLQIVTDYFYSNAASLSDGFCFMLANPKNGGAMKRMNMYLRWMVRKSDVDFGIWKFIPQSELLIPLDTHVAKVSRDMGLLKRKSNDFKAVIELTNKLKEYDKKDPAKYDFAIYGLGIKEFE